MECRSPSWSSFTNFRTRFFSKTFDNFPHGIFFALLEAISFIIIVTCARAIYRTAIIGADDLKCKRRKRAMSIFRDFLLCDSVYLRKLELQKHQVTTIVTIEASPEDEDSMHRSKTMSIPYYNNTQVEIINILLNILTTCKYKFGFIHFIVAWLKDGNLIFWIKLLRDIPRFFLSSLRAYKFRLAFFLYVFDYEICCWAVTTFLLRNIRTAR